MASTKFTFGNGSTIVTYDLQNNDITAKEISDASNGKFKTYIQLQNGNKYNLPNTTLWDTASSSIDDTITAFGQAFRKAKANKIGAKSVISRVLVLDVSKTHAYMEDEN